MSPSAAALPSLQPGGAHGHCTGQACTGKCGPCDSELKLEPYRSLLFNQRLLLLRRRLKGSSTLLQFSSVPGKFQLCRETPGKLWTSAGECLDLFFSLTF